MATTRRSGVVTMLLAAALILAAAAGFLMAAPFSGAHAAGGHRSTVACGAGLTAAFQSRDAVDALKGLARLNAKNATGAGGSIGGTPSPPSAASLRRLGQIEASATRYQACHSEGLARAGGGTLLLAVSLALFIGALVQRARRRVVASTSPATMRLHAMLGDFRARLVAIAVAGVALRTTLVFVRPHLAFDATYYDLSAKALANGHGFVEPTLSAGALAPSALFPPAYSVFLSLFAPLGAGTTRWHIFLSCCLGGITIVLVGYLGRRFLSLRASLLVAALAAVYPLMIGADTSLMSESLYLPLILGCLLVATRITTRRVWPWILLGGLLGLAALTRAEALIYLPVLVVPVAVVSSGTALRKFVVVGTTVATVVVVLAPWLIRSDIAFHQPVLLANSSGNLVGGANCPTTYYGPYLGFWDLGCLRSKRPGAAQMNETQLNNALRSDGTQYLDHHLGRLPVVVAARLLRTYGFYSPTQELRLESHESRAYAVQVLGWLMYLALLPFALIGARRLMRDRHEMMPANLIALTAPFVAVTLMTIVTYGNERFRIAAEPCLLVLAVIGAKSAVDRWARPARPARARRGPAQSRVAISETTEPEPSSTG